MRAKLTGGPFDGKEIDIDDSKPKRLLFSPAAAAQLTPPKTEFKGTPAVYVYGGEHGPVPLLKYEVAPA